MRDSDFDYLEIFVLDYLESIDAKTASVLAEFSDDVHHTIENTILDYAKSLSISDYVPNY